MVIAALFILMGCLYIGSLVATIYSFGKAPKLYIEAIKEEVSNPFVKWVLIVAVVLAVITMPSWGAYMVYSIIQSIGG